MGVPYSSKALTNMYMAGEYLGHRTITSIGDDADRELAEISGSWISWINAASEAFQNAVGFDLFSGSLQTVLVPGNNQTSLYVPRAIAGMNTVNVYRIRYYEGPEVTDLQNIDATGVEWKWTYDSVDGWIYTTDGNRFFKSNIIEYNWEIQYDYGLPGELVSGSRIPTDGVVSYDIVPADIQGDVIRRADLFRLRAEHQGIKSTSTRDAGISYDMKDLPQDVINKYRRYV